MDLKIIDEYKPSDVERKFIEQSRHQVETSDINQSRIISEFIFGKKIEGVAEKMIISNEKHSQRILYLTMALVFVGVVQIIVQLIQIFNTIKATPC